MSAFPMLRSPCRLLLAAALLSACGGGDKEAADTPAAEEVADDPGTTEGGGEGQDAPPSASVPRPAADPTTAPLTAADIERWEKGMEGELQAIQDATAKMKEAKSGEDTLNAMLGVQEMATLAAGARAAGLDEARYQMVRTNLSAAVGYLAPPAMSGIDTGMLSTAQRDELRQMNQEHLKALEEMVPREVLEELRPRAAELRKKDLELVGARLKGVGM